jgi:hypothetical protein
MTEKQYLILVDMLQAINKQISKIGTHPISESWLNKKQVKQIFGYGETQLRNFIEENKIITSQIKSRKFYSVDSIISLIEKNITDTNHK